MKKATSILFILILLFNTGGYQVAAMISGDDRQVSLAALLNEKDVYEPAVAQIASANDLTLEHFEAYESGYGSVANFTYITVENAQATVLYKRSVNEYGSFEKDMRYDFSTARNNESERPVHPKQHDTALTSNAVPEFENQQAEIPVNTSGIIINHFADYTFSVPAFYGVTPHEPPDC